MQFYGASAFNQDLSTWNTSNVIYMSCMFYGASSFNQDLSTWNVEKVTEHKHFSLNSGIDNSNKLPKFKN
ncbi:BspA family leucine-rich repeat surface protein [Spiroplasma endosymbiont of Monopis laevigella]|uniref:BspA family leucine-rich repeat surface protein n=1 Tax=Spiroplasma endosymbiont of Monopis laevigella TaxID=3066312 RepID=UPI0030D24DFD